MTAPEFRIYAVFGGLALIGAIQACAAGSTKPADPACAPEQLAKIEAWYVSAALEACAGKTYDDCEALPELRAEAQEKRDAWTACGGGK
jgi:hypothetical protein